MRLGIVELHTVVALEERVVVQQNPHPVQLQGVRTPVRESQQWELTRGKREVVAGLKQCTLKEINIDIPNLLLPLKQ